MINSWIAHSQSSPLSQQWLIKGEVPPEMKNFVSRSVWGAELNGEGWESGGGGGGGGGVQPVADQ